MNKKQLKTRRNSTVALLMSNAKWRKLFELAARIEPPLGGVTWQFLFTDEPQIGPLNVAQCLVCDNSRFADCWPFPCIELKDIDWIFVPDEYHSSQSDPKRPLPMLKNDVNGFIALAQQNGQFPLERTDTGVKITGYQWR